MRRNRATKIIATLGPASSSRETVKALFEAGADVFRLNFSHGTREDHRNRHKLIREVETELKRPIGILADLQGPKLRLGTFRDGPITLEKGATFRLDRKAEPGDISRVALPHPEIFEALRPGLDLLLDDGRVKLRVEHLAADWMETRVLVGGTLSDRKGVNLPGAVLPLAALTPKDREDLSFALELGIDWVALSFVQRPEDVAEARKLVAGRAGVLAKIEKPAALDRMHEVIELSDAIMVARGDLGVEAPLQEVPALQKRLVRAARLAGKSVVVATQMLESMVQSPSPTRAEVSDVATAVYDGADAIMLSAESASGKFPVEAVAMMDLIAQQVESDPLYRGIMDAEHANPEATSADAITAAARQVAETVNAAAIITYTTSGSTAIRAARERPTVSILCLTPAIQTARRLALTWGIHCVPNVDVTNFGDMVDQACRVACEEGYARPGDRLVITAGVPFGTPGAPNNRGKARVGADGTKGLG